MQSGKSSLGLRKSSRAADRKVGGGEFAMGPRWGPALDWVIILLIIFGIIVLKWYAFVHKTTTIQGPYLEHWSIQMVDVLLDRFIKTLHKSMRLINLSNIIVSA